MSADLSRLQQRSAIVRAVRAFFDAREYLEVETPLRVRAPGQEVHIDAFPAGQDRYLITSPEYHMKRLLSIGHPRLYQLARCFRAGESGTHHQPEFTMLEWYCAGLPLAEAAADAVSLLGVARAAAGGAPPPQAVFTTVASVMQTHAGVRMRGDESLDELLTAVRAAGHQTAMTASGEPAAWDDIFFQVFVDHVEPALTRAGVPTVVCDWPLPLAALARRHPDNPAVAERFELYAGGLELANAYAELTDPAEQRRRFVEENQRRAALGKTVYPLDEPLLAALATMPPASGVALGLDRLVMYALGLDDIGAVVAFDARAV